MELILKKTRELLVIMTGCPEYKYWLPDNDKLVIPDGILPQWTAVIASLEALTTKLKDDQESK